nr:hypothetical protein [uncultured Mediterranean phage uvMED]
MALSSSGSIDLSQIQAEWGGSNPISMSEYYTGSLQSDSLSNATTATVASHTTSVYTPATKLIGAYTTYYYNNGWSNSNITGGNSTNQPALGSNSAATSKISGTDKTGNAGAVPSSGAVQFDHFRGTAKGTTTSYTCYGWMNRSGQGILSYYQMHLYLAGHWGTDNESTTWSGVPFRWVDTTAEGNMPATRWYGSDAQSNNGASTAKDLKVHTSYPNIGNVTVFRWTTPSSNYSGFSGTVTMTFQF